MFAEFSRNAQNQRVYRWTSWTKMLCALGFKIALLIAAVGFFVSKMPEMKQVTVP